MTTVINLYGGSGLGKSTTAAGLFYEMKLAGQNVELVQEFVKGWAWEGRKITKEDQPEIFKQQKKLQERLYNKVEYIITDSPLLLCSMYDKFYNGTTEIESSILEHLNNSGVKNINLMLTRHKSFNPIGRYENESTAKEVDGFLKHYLTSLNIPFTTIESKDRERVQEIMDLLSGVSDLRRS